MADNSLYSLIDYLRSNNKLSDLIVNSGQEYGNRYGNNGQKQAGYFGELKLPTGDIATEYSVGQNINGRNVEMPSIVPTLSATQLAAALQSAAYGEELPSDVLQKSAEWARQRMQQGQSPFWRIPERQYIAPTKNVAPSIANDLIPTNTLDLFK